MDKPLQETEPQATVDVPRPAAAWPFAWTLPRALLVVAFAFLVASFPARNPEIWRHLAAGKALVQGDYRLCADPFATTTEGATWVNHAWLFDLLAYAVHQAAGASALVIGKAILLAILASVLVWVGWRKAATPLSTLLVAVAFVGMSPYLLFQPTFVTLLFLGLTYVWLETHSIPRSWRSCVPLLILFVLWANVDEWFLLGPALVFLWWLGSVARPGPDGANPSAHGRQGQVPLLLVAALGLAAAIVNPHHVRVFTAPALLEPASAYEWIEEPEDQTARRSPLEWIHTAGSLEQPPRVAYALLVLMGALAFLVQGRTLHLPRLVVWLAFLGLSVYRSGAIPFFAVVAGPIAAIELHRALARRSATGPPLVSSRLVAGLLQLGSAALLVVGILAAWVGWVRSYPGEPCGWSAELNPSLEAAARRMAAWRSDGKLAPEARGLPTSARMAYALAWLAPSEKSFCDARPHLFAAAVRDDFAALRRMLFSPTADPREAKEWRALLRKYQITHLIVDDADDAALSIGLRRLFASRLWTLQYLHGRTTIFAAADGEPVLHVPVVDVNQRAWRPTPADQSPATGPSRDAEAPTLLEALHRPTPHDPPGRDESRVWQSYFDAQRVPYGQRSRLLWSLGLAASLVALPANETLAVGLVPGDFVRDLFLQAAPGVHPGRKPPPPNHPGVQVALRFQEQHDLGPPAALMLAVRAARRALLESPEDATAHRNLGEAYLRLRRHTRERGAQGTFEALERVRRIQIVTALSQAAVLQPKQREVHELLAAFYRDIGTWDLALEHFQTVVQLLEAEGPARYETPAQYRERLAQWQTEEQDLARDVRDAQLAIRAPNLDAFQRAKVALQAGLAGLALRLLDEADVGTLGRDGVLQRIDLLLQTGQIGTARALLQPELEPVVGANLYRRLHANLSAARGDYAAADQDLASLDFAIDLPELRLRMVQPQHAVGLLLGRYLLDRAGVPLVLEPPSRFLVQADNARRGLAEIAALRGLLALEAGDVEAGRGHLERSVRSFLDPQGAGEVAQHYLGLMR